MFGMSSDRLFGKKLHDMDEDVCSGKVRLYHKQHNLRVPLLYVLNPQTLVNHRPLEELLPLGFRV